MIAQVQQLQIERQTVGMIFNIFLCSYIFCYIIITYADPFYLICACISICSYYYNHYEQSNNYKSSWNRFITSDIPFVCLYCLWILVFSKTSMMYFSPLLLSSIGKVLLINNKKQEATMFVVEQMIILGGKLELLIICASLPNLVVGKSTIVEILILILICKLKYSFHYGTQKSFAEIHASLDRFSKVYGNRNAYQLLYRGIALAGRTYLSENTNRDKEVVY